MTSLREEDGDDRLAEPQRRPLRLVASTEPSVVFASLASHCVPDMCDTCTIDVIDGVDARYRISHPLRSGSGPAGGLSRLADRAAVDPDHHVRIEFASPGLRAAGTDQFTGTNQRDWPAANPDSWDLHGFQGFAGFPGFRGSVTFVWHRRAVTRADRSMADLLVEHAVHMVGWQRNGQAAQAAAANIANLRIALQTSRHIGAAIGILMGRYKITGDRAYELLGQAGEHCQRKVRDVALDVVANGDLDPAPRPGPESTS